MSDSQQTVQCPTHGPQPQAFVCQHILRSLDTHEAVGFHWSEEDDGPYPDAWCFDCEEARVAVGDWTDELMREVGVALVCAFCYQSAKSIWLKARGAGEHAA